MSEQGLQFRDCVYDSDGRFDVGGVRFNTSVTDYTRQTTSEEIVLLKNRAILDFYRQKFEGKPISKILEFGTWEGGSPIFFAAATNARKIVGIDIRDSAAAIGAQAAKFGERLKLVYNTSQADREKVGAVIDREFDGLIDLVIDDASHQYELTKAAFEIAFARLRVGGYYIIEDWNWAHYSDRQFDKMWAAQPALSNLALEIVLALGSYGPIETIEIRNWCVVIEKGAEVARDFRLENLIRMGDRRKYTRY